MYRAPRCNSSGKSTKKTRTKSNKIDFIKQAEEMGNNCHIPDHGGLSHAKVFFFTKTASQQKILPTILILYYIIYYGHCSG